MTLAKRKQHMCPLFVCITWLPIQQIGVVFWWLIFNPKTTDILLFGCYRCQDGMFFLQSKYTLSQSFTCWEVFAACLHIYWCSWISCLNNTSNLQLQCTTCLLWTVNHSEQPTTVGEWHGIIMDSLIFNWHNSHQSWVTSRLQLGLDLSIQGW